MAENGDIAMELNSVEDVIKDAKSKGNKKLSVERIYQKKTQLEHILLRPDTYIGSVEPVTQAMWVYDGEEEKMFHREITFVPGLYKIFDEILVNAADNKQRDKNMDCIKIDIEPEKNRICIWNNGKGIPVVEHKDEKMFVPSLIFGHLLTSSNYNDEERKVTGGRNGYGAKLCNIFSTKFTVETSCKQYNKCFKQTWSDNMSKASDPKVMPVKADDFTCVTFFPDLKKFKMEVLDKDIVALMSRRAFDVAGVARGVKVYLNGKRLPVKGFKDYIELYTKNKEDENGDPLKLVTDIVSDRWEVAMTLSTSGFQQISFVNSIATTKGGRHVDYIVDQLTSKISENVKKKNKTGKDVRPFQIKSHIWVFVNCLIENPTFDSQTKENMTLQIKNFGSKCVLNEKFITTALKCGIIESIMSWVKFKAQTELEKKCTSKKLTKLKGVPKLEDANDAGTKNSINCTLILTEGDSAKSLAVSGLGVIGRDRYGVFPLKGKMLNVREASHKQILENAEINNIIKIMGLQYKKKYDNVDDLKTLRYGKLMIMTDQDQDGSHIKGLLINFIHHNWPSLLRLPFLEEFITPIVKASKGKEERSFFSLPEFEEWKKDAPNWPTWKVKYYKGLGTSTSKEAKEYFSDMLRHRITFQYSGAEDDHAIQLAFSKKMIDGRKEWLTNGMEERKRRREMGLPELYLYGKNTTRVTYNDFVNKELILFSNMDNERSIPSLVDGLKPGQRKVLFTCLKRNDKRDVKVAQLAGSVAELSAYHHGEVSLTGTIINLAQNFVGSNNINLLQPLGQFGTRLQGGKDAASPRYIHTMLSPLTKLLFSSLDEPLLRHLYDDNLKIEPEYYVPIIPMVLVNGAEGIGTGWSTKIPNYNTRDIVKNIYRMLSGDDPVDMLPWFKNFRGTIDSIDSQHFVVSGEVATLGNDRIEITELPIRVWTQAYKENVLEVMVHGSDKIQPFISNYKEYHTDVTVRFVVNMTPDKYKQAEEQGFHKAFKLQSSLATSSMVLFDHNGCLRKYETPVEILKEFYDVRYSLYEKRKDYLLGVLGAEASKLSNQARFILEKIENKIVIENKRKVEMIRTLQERGYDSDPVKAWKEMQKLQQDNEDTQGDSETEDESSSGGPDYDYLLGMSLWSLTREKKEELLKKRDEKVQELENLKKKTPADLWKDDLKMFMDELDKVEKKELEDESGQVVKTKGKAGLGGKKQKTAEEAKPSLYGTRVTPIIDEVRKKVEKKQLAPGEGKRRKKKDDIKLEDDMDEPMVPLSERVENSPLVKKEIKGKKMKQATLAFKSSKKSPSKNASPTKGGKKKKKNPWSDTESESVSDISDADADDFVPQEKREMAPRRATGKAKYTYDSDEKSEGSDVEMHDYNPEGDNALTNRMSDSDKSDDDIVPKRNTNSEKDHSGDDFDLLMKLPTKKAARKKSDADSEDDQPPAKIRRPVSKSSSDGDMFTDEPKKNSDLEITEREPEPVKKAIPRKYTKKADGDKPAAKAKKPRKKASSSDDLFKDSGSEIGSDHEGGLHDPKPVVKKTAPRKKTAKKDNADNPRPPKGKKPKKKAASSSDEDDFTMGNKEKAKSKKKGSSDEDDFSIDIKAKPKPKKKGSSDDDLPSGNDDANPEDDESFVLSRPARSGRACAPVKYNFGDDDSSD